MAATRRQSAWSVAGLLARRISWLWRGDAFRTDPDAPVRPFRIVRLGASERGVILLHYLTLGSEDRSVRFHGRVRYASLLERSRSIDWDKTHSLGAVAGTRLVGLVELALTSVNGTPCTEIAVSVLRPWQNQGVATALLQTAIADVHTRDAHAAILFTQISNRAMVSVCRKLGGRGELSRGELRFRFDPPTAQIGTSAPPSA